MLVTAARLGAPPAVLARMGLNIAVDTLAGAIPLVGDVFDAGYKTNVRNLRLLETWVQRPAPTRRASRVRVFATVAVAVALVLALLFAVWKIVAWAFSAVGS